MPANVFRVPARLLLFLPALFCAAAATAGGERIGLPAPTDIAADATRAAAVRQPLVILFSLAGCSYCDVVRQNYLTPLFRDHAGVVVREVQVNGTATFIDFDGKRISHEAFAWRYGVRFAPTVILLGRNGTLLAEPIIGGDTAGLYGGYLDNALGEAMRKLAAGRKIETSGK